ncbi:MAG TPA: pseudouridine synthase [Atribacteraceae bacterium]|nr:pseudouridine synthase [Atribacteraceae bacterium]
MNEAPPESGGERLNKFLARLGVASRRGCEEIIRAGRVAISGKPAIDPGRLVLTGESVTLDGKPLIRQERTVYIKFYKPRDVLTTVRDPFGRKTVMSFFSEVPDRIYPVGRLDQDSEGLLLLTNDGALTYRLTHPRFEIPKKYRVFVSGTIELEELDFLKSGIEKNGTTYRIASGEIKGYTRDCSIVDLILFEGKKHEIRILFDSLKHPVLRLIRLAMGPFILDQNILPGQWKYFTQEERKKIQSLMEENTGCG